MRGIGYDPGVDYRAKINEAKAAGNYKRAGVLEAMRNAKIEGEGLDYAPTYEFALRGEKTENPESSSYTQQLYGAKKQKALEALRTQYDRNVSDIGEAIAKITATYADARSRAAADLEKSARGFNERAASSGLNALHGQAARARTDVLRGKLQNLKSGETDELSEKERKMKALREKYLIEAAKTQEKSDSELTKAIIKEYQRQASASGR